MRELRVRVATLIVWAITHTVPALQRPRAWLETLRCCRASCIRDLARRNEACRRSGRRTRSAVRTGIPDDLYVVIARQNCTRNLERASWRVPHTRVRSNAVRAFHRQHAGLHRVVCVVIARIVVRAIADAPIAAFGQIHRGHGYRSVRVAHDVRRQCRERGAGRINAPELRLHDLCGRVLVVRDARPRVRHEAHLVIGGEQVPTEGAHRARHASGARLVLQPLRTAHVHETCLLNKLRVRVTAVIGGTKANPIPSL